LRIKEQETRLTLQEHDDDDDDDDDDYEISLNFTIRWGTRWRSWLTHCATSRKVAGSIPGGVTGIFQ